MKKQIVCVSRRTLWTERMHATQRPLGTSRVWFEELERRVLCSGAGELDPTFGQAGMISLDAIHRVEPQEFVTDAFADSAGRFYVIGEATFDEVFVARLLADGQLDTTFATGGVLHVPQSSTTWGDSTIEMTSGAVDLQGRVVVLGTVQDDHSARVMVRRYLEDGRPDVAFDGDGEMQFALPDDPTARAMGNDIVIDAQGRITLTGFTADFAPLVFTDALYSFLARVTPDGVLDASFGDRGIVQFDAPIAGAFGSRGLDVDSRGHIVLTGGIYYPDTNNQIDAASGYSAALRLNPDGSYDASFGSGGWWVHKFGPLSEWLNGRVDSQDRIVARFVGDDQRLNDAGLGDRIAGPSGFIRLDNRGKLDASFGNGGIISVPDPESDDGMFVIETDDRVLFNKDGAIVRYQPDGSFDPTFTTGRLASHDWLPWMLQIADRLLVGTLRHIENSANIDYDYDERVDIAGVSLGSLIPIKSPESPVESVKRGPQFITAPYSLQLPRWFQSDSVASGTGAGHLLGDESKEVLLADSHPIV